MNKSGECVSRSCPACGAAAWRTLHRLSGRTILACRSCGLARVAPLPDEAAVERLERLAYTEGLLPETRGMFDGYGPEALDRPRDPIVRGYLATLAALDRMRSARRGRRLLDVGVGTGLFLALARRSDWEVEGVDISPEAAHSARTRFGVPVAVGPFERVSPEGPFDAITMWDVLEHARDPGGFVEKAFALLAPEGSLFVAVPDRENLLFRLVDVGLRAPPPGARGTAEKLYVANHLSYFSRRSLSHLLARAGFSPPKIGGARPHLGRYRLTASARVPLSAVFHAGALLGRPGRILAYARKPLSGAARR